MKKLYYLVNNKIIGVRELFELISLKNSSYISHVKLSYILTRCGNMKSVKTEDKYNNEITIFPITITFKNDENRRTM